MTRSVVRLLLTAVGITAMSISPASAELHATLVANGFNHPLGFIQHPTDTTVQFVLEQGGRVRILKSGVVQPVDFLDLRGQIASGGEQGFLGLAFAPDFATSGRVFTSFTNLSGHSVIARFVRLAGDPMRADLNSRLDLKWPDGRRFIEQPFTNHNGGNIAFGPDGYLYVGFGDGGSGDDPFNFAQSPLALLGKMLRLDVSVADGDDRGYRVPSSNPFAGQAGVLGEIWSVGMRNPWRWSFDDPKRGGTGALVIADVGQNAWEEIDYLPSAVGGRNFGWRNREGAHNNVTSVSPFSAPLRDPLWEYSHNVGSSVTGGFVYRGTALGSSYVGRYFFGDYVSSRIWSLGLRIDPITREAMAETLVEHTAELAAGSTSPASFGVDAAGELYVVNYSGAIYRIDGPPGQVPAETPHNDGPRSHTGDSRGTAKPR